METENNEELWNDVGNRAVYMLDPEKLAAYAEAEAAMQAAQRAQEELIARIDAELKADPVTYAALEAKYDQLNAETKNVLEKFSLKMSKAMVMSASISLEDRQALLKNQKAALDAKETLMDLLGIKYKKGKTS